MRKLLLISLNQYGYHTDYYKYCQYLKDEYDITYLCLDNNEIKIAQDGVRVIYIKTISNKFLNKINFYLRSLSNILFQQYKIIMISYFRTCSLYKILFPYKKIVLDIRSACVISDDSLREKFDRILVREAKMFDNITIISEGLKTKLKLKAKKIFILPLGADAQIDDSNLYEDISLEMKLIYVGVFDYRKVEKSIRGFKIFYDKYNKMVNCRYTIIGYAGNKIYEDKIINEIKINNLQGIINYVGRVPNYNLGEYFKNHNIGVSYIPITDYFQFQPPTKTYEYLANGLICIATTTYENRKIINNANGVLVGELPYQFFRGLEFIYFNLDYYKKINICNSVKDYTWENIVNEKLKKYLLDIIN